MFNFRTQTSQVHGDLFVYVFVVLFVKYACVYMSALDFKVINLGVCEVISIVELVGLGLKYDTP